jgi:hypothetical protein
MKVRYIGEEAQIGSRATLAFGRTWHIGEWVDVHEGLGDAYWAQFGGKISKNPFFEVDEGGGEKVTQLDSVTYTGSDDAVSDKPARKPRKPKQ